MLHSLGTFVVETIAVAATVAEISSDTTSSTASATGITNPLFSLTILTILTNIGHPTSIGLPRECRDLNARRNKIGWSSQAYEVSACLQALLVMVDRCVCMCVCYQANK